MQEKQNRFEVIYSPTFANEIKSGGKIQEVLDFWENGHEMEAIFTKDHSLIIRPLKEKLND